MDFRAMLALLKNKEGEEVATDAEEVIVTKREIVDDVIVEEDEEEVTEEEVKPEGVGNV